MKLGTAVTMASPRLDDDEVEAARLVLVGGALRSGPIAREFEERFAEYVGARHAYSCSSGTAALHLAYLSVIEPGDEVLVPAMTFFATASAVVLAGGVPVFCDVDPRTFVLDLDDAASRITERTRAVCPVYLFGQPLDAEALTEFATRDGLSVIGDAAQALGSRWGSRHVGSEAALTTHSFYPTKNLFVGEGGMVTTDVQELDELGRLLRSHGQGRKYHHSHIGLNYRLTDVEAAIGLAQLPKIDSRNERRRSIATTYDAAFSGLAGIATPYVPGEAVHTYHQYTLIIDPQIVGPRDDFADGLASCGVGSQINYPMSLHRQEVFIDRLGIDRGPLPVCEELCRTVLSIPVHHNLSDAEVEKVVDVVTEIATTMTESRRVG